MTGDFQRMRFHTAGIDQWLERGMYQHINAYIYGDISAKKKQQSG
jgi:hypothetical protein